MTISFSGIIEKTLGGIIAGLFVLLIKNYFDNPMNFTSFYVLTNFDYILITAIIIVGVILIIVLIKSKSRKFSGFLAPLFPMDYSSYIKMATIDYHDVRWVIVRPHFGVSSTADIIVAVPPRCTTCDIELEEKPIRFGKFEWKCVRGHFKKKSKTSFDSLVSHVEKAARNDWENGRIH